MRHVFTVLGAPFWLSVVLFAGLPVGLSEVQGQQPDEATADEEPAVEQPAKKPLREQTIYVPYSKLRDIFEKEGRGVFLPYDQFQELWQKARQHEAPDPQRPVRPPVDALLTAIESEAVVTDDVVRVTAKANIEVLRIGWHQVPLRLGDAAVLEARLDGQPARLVHRQGGYHLLIEKEDAGRSEFELELVYAKAFTKSPGQNTVSFQAPQAPVNRWRIRVPEAGVKVNIHPLIAATEAPLDADQPPDEPAAVDETIVLAFIGAAPEVRIDWNPKAEGATGLGALATVEAQQEISVDEGVLRSTTRLTYDISRAEIAQLEIDVPADHKVVNVFDPNVRQWDVTRDGEVQHIVVQLFQPTRGTQRLTVELEQFQEDLLEQGVTAPVVRAVGAGRQHGTVVVRLSGTLRGKISERTGLL